MGNEKKKKPKRTKRKWVLRWNAPAIATLRTPLEIVIEQAPTDPPLEVEIQIWESDAKRYEIDDYTAEAPDLIDPAGQTAKKRPKKSDRERRTVDDHIASFSGTLEPHPARPDGWLFRRSTEVVRYLPEQGNDHIWVLFEGEDESAKTEIPIAGTGYEAIAQDGRFFEVYLVVVKAGSGKELAASEVHYIRRRTDVLLAVEPLCQGSVQLSNFGMADMIMEYFHGGDTSTADRYWGETVVAMREDGPGQVQAMGCSYTVLTMLARYLRFPVRDAEAPAEVQWETLYDRTAGRTLPSASRPLSDCVPIPRHQKLAAAAKALKNSDRKIQRVKVVTGPERAYNGSAPPGVSKRGQFSRHYWVSHMVWWVRSTVGATTSDRPIGRAECRFEISYADTQKIEPALDDEGKPFYKYSFAAEPPKTTYTDKRWRVFPPTKTLSSTLGLTVTSLKLSNDSAANWQQRLMSHLERGLPAVALMKSGRYAPASGGHFVLVVGYRITRGCIRFIVNDPGGARALQYECLDESDVEVQRHSEVSQPTSLRVEFRVSGEKQVIGSVDFAESELRSATKTAALGPPCEGTVINVQFETAASSRTTFREIRVLLAETGSAPQRLRLPTSFVKAGFASKDPKQFTTSGGIALDVTVSGSYAKREGPMTPAAWDGLHDVLVDRRKSYSLAYLYFVETTEPWARGAARFLRYDGRIDA